MKRVLKAIIWIVVIVLIIRWWTTGSTEPVNPNDHTATLVTIPEGSSLKKIAALLKERNMIRSESAFISYVKKNKAESQLKAGIATLDPSMDVSQIVQVLENGNAEQMVITIPEGYTVKDIDALLAKKGLSKTGEITDCANNCSFDRTFLPTAGALAKRGGRLEGYLFPDTYYVSVADFTSQSFLDRLLGTFQKKVIDAKESDIAASGHSLHEIVTMASIIESETHAGAERPIVSGILWKRFEEKMGLDVDAAVRYILDKPSAQITRSDLEIDSPYNMRKYRGLPPGPISNPGIESINAALNPEESPYYYYLHGSDGQIHYAKTNDEHNANKAKYLQ